MKSRLDSLFDALLPLFATIGALLVGALMLIILDVNPLVAYLSLIDGAFGSSNAIAETIVKATPLLLVGIGICIAYRGNVINIGGEGQMIVGAIAATWFGLRYIDLPGWLMIVLAMLIAAAAGSIWGGIPGALKAYFNVNEILSTVMMNAIAVQLLNYVLTGPMIDPIQSQKASQIPQTARLVEAYRLPRWVPTRLHLGAIIAVILAILVYILLWRTTLGYRIRSVGQNKSASRYAGIKVNCYIIIALMLSGALAGLAGATQVYGVNYRMITDGSTSGFTGRAGYNGIVAALFGSLHPLLTIPASVLFGGLLVGANTMQRVTQVPSTLITALNGLVVVFVVSSEIWRKKRQQKRLTVSKEEQDVGIKSEEKSNLRVEKTP